MLKPMDRAWQPRALNEIPTGRLHAAGLRPTMMRLVLLDLFEQCRDRSLSCEEAYRLLIRGGYSVSLSSTYANIRRLAAQGVLAPSEPRQKVRVCATFMLPQ